jgi:hypothetical protein
MEYSKIIAVTGLPGLYELVNSKTDGAIVRSLEDKSSKFVSNRVHQFSQLESIEVFTVRENKNLVEILKAMDTSKEKLPDEKEGDLKAYFKKVVPDLDFDRVYNSDLKKMIKWFAILKKNDIEFKLPEEPVEEAEEPVAEKAEEKKKEEPAPAETKPEAKTKKAAPKKAAAEKKEPAAEVKPKKAPAKKKSAK